MEENTVREFDIEKVTLTMVKQPRQIKFDEEDFYPNTITHHNVQAIEYHENFVIITFSTGDGYGVIRSTYPYNSIVRMQTFLRGPKPTEGPQDVVRPFKIIETGTVAGLPGDAA